MPFNQIRNIIAISAIPTAVVDKNMCYIAVSEKWINFYQLQGLELIGKSHYEIFPEITESWKKIHSDCLQGKDQSSSSDRFDRANGSTIYLKWEVRHFIGDDGAIGGMMMTCEDITLKQKSLINENRFQLLMDNFPGMCWVSGIDHTLKYANKCFYETLHLTDDILGKKNVEIFGEDIAKRGNARNEYVLESGMGIEFEQSSTDEHGHPQVYKIYKFPFTDANGEGNLIGSIAFDITKNTLLKEELHKSEAQFKLAFEHSLVGMALINPNGTLKRVNNSLCQMLGYTENEMKMLSIHELTHPEDRAHSMNMLNELNVGKIERIKFEKRYIHRNGQTVWVIIAATMLYDQQGKSLYYISQIEDITSRKEIENDLILSEKKYRTIFENVQDVFYQTDQKGLVLEISPSIEKYSGYVREKIIGKSVTDFYFYPQDRDRIMECLLKDGFVIDFEVRLKTIDHELRYASVNARLIVENGLVIATEGSMRDVTSRKFQENTLKALNSELTDSNQQKNKLLSIIGHDLRNPIAGTLQLLNFTIEDFETINPSEVKSYLFAMKQELTNANHLLEDLLEWAKLQFNAASFDPIHIKDLTDLMNKSIKTILPMADKKNIAVKIELPASLSLVADSAMLETVIRNLMSNAVKFTQPSGEVSMRVTASETEIKFAIKDTGIGISKEKMHLLFGVNSVTTFGTQGERGTGLGLGLCHDFVVKHKGQIWVDSEIGNGSTFYFTIPKNAF